MFQEMKKKDVRAKSCWCVPCSKKARFCYHFFELCCIDPLAIVMISILYYKIGQNQLFSYMFDTNYVPDDTDKKIMKNFKKMTIPLFIFWIIKIFCGAKWAWNLYHNSSRRVLDNTFMVYFLISFSLYATISFELLFWSLLASFSLSYWGLMVLLCMAGVTIFMAIMTWSS